MRPRPVSAGYGLLCLIAAGCSRRPTTDAAPTGMSTAAAPAPIQLTLADYAITAPATLPAGYSSFRTVNTGKELHQAALVRLDSNKTYSDFLNAMKTNGPLPGWVVLLGGPQNSGEVGLDLAPGHYVWYCVIPSPDGSPHLVKGMSAPMTVTAASGPSATPPTADIAITARDYQWDLSAPITAGHHVLKVTVAPGQPHEMVIVQLAPGKTAQDVIAWVVKPVGPPPAESVQGIAAMNGGETNYASADFTPGNYAMLCFLPAATDGKPHIAHGMVKEFTVQ